MVIWSIKMKMKLNEVDKAVLAKFPVGTLITSTIGEGGPSKVFIGDGLHIQPFSYLGDYDVAHFEEVKREWL